MNNYTTEQLCFLLESLLANATELPWLEWKSSNEDPETIGKYISALSNSACVEKQEFAYMIWGIEDKTKLITGTKFNPDEKRKGNQPLKIFLKTNIKPHLSFEFYKFLYNEKPIVLLEIEAAYRQPIMFYSDAYVRIGESCTELRKQPDLVSKIYNTLKRDWSAETIIGASIHDLDPEAIQIARKNYFEKHKNDSFASDIKNWNDLTFLTNARLIVDGKITRAALVLLGKKEASRWLNPSIARITWTLYETNGLPKDYCHFDPPLLLAVNKVFSKIRNVTIREMPDGSLFPVEISQYDNWVFREALHNCIAHQDYDLRHTIVVAEHPDRIQFSNMGEFQPGSIKSVLENTGRPRFYQNRLLTDAMVELNMIDTIGSGIKKMFIIQQERYMPMPEYTLTSGAEAEVQVTIFGKILDVRYTNLLMKRLDVPLNDIILLDKLQKRQKIEKSDAIRLRKKGLIEGRFPNVYPAAAISAEAQDVKGYLDRRACDDAFYIQQILTFLCVNKSASRNQIRDLLKDKLSITLTDEQKETKIGNLLAVTMKNRGLIQYKRGPKISAWELTNEGRKICKSNNQKCKLKCIK